jgi:hypothetical protein
VTGTFDGRAPGLQAGEPRECIRKQQLPGGSSDRRLFGVEGCDTFGARRRMKLADSNSSPAEFRSPPQPMMSTASALDGRDWAVMGLLLACLAAMFWRVLFTHDLLFYRDVYDYSYPHALFIRAALRHGHLPYWNPLLNYGEPVLANPNFLFFYPTTLLLVLLPFNFAFTQHFLLHFALAATGTYVFARRLSQSRFAAFFAAFVFGFSGPMLSLGNFYNEVACAAWIPWALVATDRAVRNPQARRPWIALVVVFALQFLAAEPLTLLATFALCFGYALCLTPSGADGAKQKLRIAARFVLVGILMVGVCAIQFLPALDLLHNSRRGVGGFPYGETTYWSMHPLSLLEVLLPDFFASPFAPSTLWTAMLNFRNSPYFPSVFCGFLPIFLAWVGWALGRDRRRHWLGAAGILLLLLAMGKFLPIFRGLYAVFPPLHLLRFPLKLLVPAVFCAAILAGWGLEGMRRKVEVQRSRRSYVLLPLVVMLVLTGAAYLVAIAGPGMVGTFTTAVLNWTNQRVTWPPVPALDPDSLQNAAAYLAGRCRLFLPGLLGFEIAGLAWFLAVEKDKRWTRAAGPLAVMLACLQLVLANYGVNPTVPRGFYTYRPPALAAMAEAPRAPYRYCYIYHLAQPAHSGGLGFLNFESIPVASGLSPLAQQAFRDRLLLARAMMLTGVEGVIDNDVEWSFPPELEEFWVFALTRLDDAQKMECLVGRTNVKYFVSPGPRESAVLKQAARFFTGSDSPGYVYEDLCAAPRAYAVAQASYYGDSSQALSAMASPDFHPLGQAVLAAPPAPETEHAMPAPAGEVDIVSRTDNAVELRVNLDRPGYVLLLDRFSPDWKASVDGRDAPVVRANQIFQAVFAQPGIHSVRFYWHQRGLLPGLALSLATILLLGWLYARDPDAHPMRRSSSSGGKAGGV